MKYIYIFLIACLPVIGTAQMGNDGGEVYLKGDRIDAQFQGGGIEKFQEFVKGNFNYSKVKKPGRMIAAFTIDADGSVKNIKLVEFIDAESAAEMIRVLNICPKWEPAKRGGKPISIEIKYPMTFKRT